jgi:hypothetical protein
MKVAMLFLAFSVLFFTVVVNGITPGYIYSPFAPSALYQESMNLSFISGSKGTYQEQAGQGTGGIYNGVLGVTFDRTYTYGFITSADGKKLRKLNYQTAYVGSDITRKP